MIEDEQMTKSLIQNDSGKNAKSISSTAYNTSTNRLLHVKILKQIMKWIKWYSATVTFNNIVNNNILIENLETYKTLRRGNPLERHISFFKYGRGNHP